MMTTIMTPTPGDKNDTQRTIRDWIGSLAFRPNEPINSNRLALYSLHAGQNSFAYFKNVITSPEQPKILLFLLYVFFEVFNLDTTDFVTV